MEIVIAQTEKVMSRIGADRVAAVVKEKTKCVLGFATGMTPIGIYRCLIQDYRKHGLDFSGVTTFNLDEYCSMEPKNPYSYYSFMWDNLFSHINITADKVHLPWGNTDDLKKECNRYDEAIQKAGGIDLQILGIGCNGHIGFNEPGSSFEDRTHIVELTESTRIANSRLFSSIDEVPHKAITMGIKTIMEARNIILLCSGEGKADILHRAVTGPVTEEVPASVLQRHPACTIIADLPAAKKLIEEGRSKKKC